MKHLTKFALALCVLAAGLLSGMPATAATQPPGAQPLTPPHDVCQNAGGYGWFGIGAGQNGNSGLWLDAAGATSPADLIIWPGNGGDNQQWCFVPTGDGSSYFIQSLYNDQWNCIDVPHGDFSAGTRMLAYACNKQFNQRWLLCTRSSAPNYSMEPAATPPASKWLDVWGGPGPSAYVAGHPIQLWTGNGADNQRFWLSPSPGESGRVIFPPATPNC